MGFVKEIVPNFKEPRRLKSIFDCLLDVIDIFSHYSKPPRRPFHDILSVRRRTTNFYHHNITLDQLYKSLQQDISQ